MTRKDAVDVKRKSRLDIDEEEYIGKDFDTGKDIDQKRTIRHSTNILRGTWAKADDK